MMTLKEVTKFVRKYSLTPAILEQLCMQKILNKSISAIVSTENMRVRNNPKKHIKCMYSSVNIVIDEQSTKLSEQLEMIHYLKNRVGVVDF